MNKQVSSSRRAIVLAGMGYALAGCAMPMKHDRAAGTSGASGKPGTLLPDLATAPPVHFSASGQIDVEVAGVQRRIFIAWPLQPAPPGGYPVLYTLDGNALFPLFAQLARNHAARPDSAQSSPPVIVGLGYATDKAYDMDGRARDYTPAMAENTAPASGSGPSGGADRFLDFLEHDLQPWLMRQLPVNPQRQILFGHSYGGLLTLYALFTRTHMFQDYIAASPSIWWGNRAILPVHDRFLQSFSPMQSTVRLLMTAGSLEEDTRNTDTERSRRQQERKQVSSARAMVESLQGRITGRFSSVAGRRSWQSAFTKCGVSGEDGIHAADHEKARMSTNSSSTWK